MSVETAQAYMQRTSIPRGSAVALPEQPPVKEPAAVRKLRQKLASGQELDILDYEAISSYFPEVAHKMAAEQARYEGVKSKLEKGEPLDVLDAIWLSSTSPATSKEYAAAQKRIETTQARLETVQGKMERSEPLDITDAILLSTYAPDVGRKYQDYLTQKESYETEKAAYETKLGEQTQFWKAQGFPQYSQYGILDIPSDMKIGSVQEVTKPANILLGKRDFEATGTGEAEKSLQVTLVPKVTPQAPIETPSLSEQLAKITVKPLIPSLMKGIGLKPIPDLMSPKGLSAALTGEVQDVHPLAAVGGILAPFESTVYSVARIVGIKTPSIPSTALSDLIGGGILWATTGKPQLPSDTQRLQEELGKDWSSYEFGSLLGEVLLGYGISKGISAAKGLLGKAYVESGLKTSHFAYQVGQVTGKIESKLPLWLTSPSEYLKISDTAESLHSIKTDLSRAIFGVKFAEHGAITTIGLPTLIEEEGAATAPTLAGVEGIFETSAAKALRIGGEVSAQTYKQLPSLMASEELMGLSEAKFTQAFGYTVPAAEIAAKGVTKTFQQVSLRQWLLSSAALSWSERAMQKWTAVEDLPKLDTSKMMIKGGRYFDLGDLSTSLGFSRSPLFSGSYFGKTIATDFGFEKAKGLRKLPSLKDLLGSGKGEATLPELVRTPAAILETTGRVVAPALPKISATLGEISLSDVLGSMAVLGVAAQPRRKERTKPMISPVVSLRRKEALQPFEMPIVDVGLKEEELPKVAELSGLKQALAMPQIQTPRQVTSIRMKPPKTVTGILFKPPRKSEDPFKGLRKMLPSRKMVKRYAIFEYPIMSEGEAARYVLGKNKTKTRKHRK